MVNLYLVIISVSCICTISAYYIIEVYTKKSVQQILTQPQNFVQRTKLVLCLLGIKARSNMHAAVAFTLAVWSLMYGDDMYRDHVWGQSEVALIACSITTGYMLGDLFVDILYWQEMGEMQYVVHHIFVIAAYSYVLRSGAMQMFSMVRLLCEGANISVNSRNVLNSLGLQRTLSFYYNSMAMLVTFFLSRILVIPILVYMLITVIGTEEYNRQSVAGRYLMWMSHIIMDPLNIRWFYKIIRSVLRMINTWHTDKNGVSGTNQDRLTSDGNGQVY